MWKFYSQLSISFLTCFFLVQQSKLNSNSIIPSGKICSCDFSAIVGCVLQKWTEKEVTREFIKKVYYRRDLESLKSQVQSGKLSLQDLWITSQKQKSLSNKLPRINENPPDSHQIQEGEFVTNMIKNNEKGVENEAGKAIERQETLEVSYSSQRELLIQLKRTSMKMLLTTDLAQSGLEGNITTLLQDQDSCLSSLSCIIVYHLCALDLQLFSA